MYRKWIPLWQFALHSFPLGLWSWWWLWRQFRWTWLWCVLSGCDLLHVQTFVSKAITFSPKWSFMGSIFNGVMLTRSPKVADNILIIWDVAVFHRMISKNKHFIWIWMRRHFNSYFWIFSELRTCHPGYFQCNSGHCVAERFRCDGNADCLDFSDETTCREFQALQSVLIELTSRKTCTFLSL